LDYSGVSTRFEKLDTSTESVDAQDLRRENIRLRFQLNDAEERILKDQELYLKRLDDHNAKVREMEERERNLMETNLGLIRQHNAEVAGLRNEISKLKNELEQKQIDRMRLQIDNGDLKDAIKKLEKKEDDDLGMFRSLKSQALAAENAASELQRSLVKEQTDKMVLEDQRSRLAKENADMNRQITTLLRELSTKREAEAIADEGRKKLEALEREVNLYRSWMTSKDAEASKLSTAASELKKSLDTVSADIRLETASIANLIDRALRSTIDITLSRAADVVFVPRSSPVYECFVELRQRVTDAVRRLAAGSSLSRSAPLDDTFSAPELTDLRRHVLDAKMALSRLQNQVSKLHLTESDINLRIRDVENALNGSALLIDDYGRRSSRSGFRSAPTSLNNSLELNSSRY